jgi:hypothetical protein
MKELIWTLAERELQMKALEASSAKENCYLLCNFALIDLRSIVSVSWVSIPVLCSFQAAA